MTVAAEVLSPVTRRVHRALIDGVLATGVVPAPVELAGAVGVDATELPDLLAELHAADYLALDPDGRVTCLYPFSPAPTAHVVIIGGHRRYAMCAIDALGIAVMLDRAIEIESACAGCGAAIRLAVSLGSIARVDPAATVVVARRSGDEPACATCCPFTLFACSPGHGDAVAARLPATTVVSVDEALRHGESIFGDLLGERLPARRRRSRPTSSRLRT